MEIRDALPKGATGKILERVLRDEAFGKAGRMSATGTAAG